MLNLIDNYMQRIDWKVPDSCLRLLRDELSELLMHYNIQPVSTELTVYEGYIPQCFAAYCVTKKIEGASDETMRNYMMQLKEFFRQMDKPLEDITANDVRAFLYTYQKEHHVCNRTLDSIRSVLGSFFSWASGEGYIQKNVMLVVKHIKYEKREREALTEYELELLRAACHTLRDEAMVEVLYSTGCRVTELVRLNLADVSFEKGEVMLFGKEGEKTTGEIKASLKLQGEKQTSLFGNMKTADTKKNESPKWTDRTGKKYAKDLKPGYTIAGEKVMEKATPSPVVEEKSEASDGFTEETKTTVTNTTGKNQAQEESFAGSVTRGIQKASLTTKFLLVIAVLETGFALFFVTAKKRFKKESKKKPKITA